MRVVYKLANFMSVQLQFTKRLGMDASEVQLFSAAEYERVAEIAASKQFDALHSHGYAAKLVMETRGVDILSSDL